ncbi:TPA: hypothetical protein ACX6QL_000513 [Photobacterium damselae]
MDFNIISVFSIPIFIIVFFSISIYMAKIFGVSNKELIIIYSWHLLFCFVYYVYSLKNGSDSIDYYYRELYGFSFGTQAIVYILSLPKLFGLNILSISIIFNFIGFVGLISFWGSLKLVVKNNSKRLQKLAFVIVLLPSVSFWSAGIGKDAISFMAMGLALWSALALERRKGLMIFAIAAMLFVRPHMAGMMIMALAFSMLFQKGVPPLQRLTVGVIALVATTIMVPFALNYAGVGENANYEQFQQYIDGRANSNTHGGGAVDIASMPLPLQMFTYLLRPLPIEARSIPQLAAALDNVILLYLMFVGGRALIKTRGLILEGNRLFMWFYVLIAWIILSMTTANLGISMRQKWMFTPILIYLLISIIAAKERRDFNISHEK